jgi:hypothetical protein
MDVAALRAEVATLNSEIDAVEFKSGIDTTQPRFWPQTIRSVAAMVNSGGGTIVFGLDSMGISVAGDLAAVRSIDPIHVSDKFKHYTDTHLPCVRREEFERRGATYVGWIVPASSSLVPFTRPGDCHNGHGKPEKLFYPGQIYVRRGASSVPASANDIEAIFARIRQAARQEFADQMTGLVALPPGFEVAGVPAGTVLTLPDGPAVLRITDDLAAPGCVVVDKFQAYPYRATELIRRLAVKMPGQRITAPMINDIRRIHEAEIRDKELVWVPLRCSPHYSENIVTWIEAKISADPDFLKKTHAAARARKTNP